MKRLPVLTVVAFVCLLGVVAARPGAAGAAGATGLSGPDATRPQIACVNPDGTYALQSDGTLWTSGTKLARVDGCAGGDEQWVALAGGEWCNLALKSDGTLWTLGAPPAQVGTDSDWVAAASGHAHNLASKSDGSLWSWGANGSGQLGTGDTTSHAAPTQISGCADGNYNWVDVGCGSDYSVSLKSDGSLWSWGANTSGQLGLGDTAPRSAPTQVTGCAGGNNNWTAVACGDSFTVARKSDGSLWTWGDNSQGQLGVNDNGTRTTPVRVTGSPAATATGSSSPAATAASRP
jgi:hypothetical protein